MTVEREDRYQVARDVHSRTFGTELVLLDLARGEYFSLDELGARVWAVLAAGGSLDDAIEALAPEYDVPWTRFQADLRALVAELVARGLLVVSR